MDEAIEARVERALREAIDAVGLADQCQDVHFWTRQQWDDDRRERYGRNAVLTMTMEGPVNHAYNYGPEPLYAAIESRLRDLGFYAELGYAWSLHVYPVPVRQVPEVERLAFLAIKEAQHLGYLYAAQVPDLILEAARKAGQPTPSKELVEQVGREVERALKQGL